MYFCYDRTNDTIILVSQVTSYFTMYADVQTNNYFSCELIIQRCVRNVRYVPLHASKSKLTEL